MKIEVSIESKLWKDCGDLSAFCHIASKEIVKEIQPFYAKSLEGEISVLFTDDFHMQKLNAQWRNKNKPTNVLSFPSKNLKIGEMPGKVLGDIVFAFETIKFEALEQNKIFSEHLYHLFIHGFLHLLGFNHAIESEANQMEAIETKILGHLNIKNPY